MMKTKIRRWCAKNGKTQKWFGEQLGLNKENWWTYMNVRPVGRWPIRICLEIERITGLEFTRKDLK